jgi:hypothetical protein
MSNNRKDVAIARCPCCGATVYEVYDTVQGVAERRAFGGVPPVHLAKLRPQRVGPLVQHALTLGQHRVASASRSTTAWIPAMGM